MNLKKFKDIPFHHVYHGKANLEMLYLHALKQNLIRYVNQQLLFYIEKEGCNYFIDSKNEWNVISNLFSEKLCEKLDHNNTDYLTKRLKNTPSLQLDEEDLDHDLNVINTKGGVLNYKTLEIRDQYYRNDWFTYRINATFIPNAKITDAPYFQGFCKTSLDGDEEKIQLLLEILGYMCCPLLKAKKAFIFLGESDCGKSVILHVFEKMIGKEFICNIPLEKISNRFSTSTLSKKRVNLCAELAAKPLKDIETFKLIVGGDTISAEFKGKDIFEFDNRCKLLFASNVLPPIKSEDVSTAFVNRITLLRFPHAIPENEKNYDLAELMEEEIDIIFSLSVMALQKLIERKFKFTTPKDSAQLLADYAFQQTNIDVFVKEKCEIKDGNRIHSYALYDAYTKFCEENLVRPISANVFSSKIGSLPHVYNSRFRIYGGSSLRGFEGIALKEAYTQDSDLSYQGQTNQAVPLNEAEKSVEHWNTGTEAING